MYSVFYKHGHAGLLALFMAVTAAVLQLLLTTRSLLHCQMNILAAILAHSVLGSALWLGCRTKGSICRAQQKGQTVEPELAVASCLGRAADGAMIAEAGCTASS